MTAPALPPPLTLTGDDATDEALALLRIATEAIHEAQEQVAGLSAERRRLVLDLREQRGRKFAEIAQAANSTEQTIYKVHREAKDERRALAHVAGNHEWCDDPQVCAAEAAADAADDAEWAGDRQAPDGDEDDEPAELAS